MKLLARLFGFLFLLIGIIGVSRMYHRSAEIATYKASGKSLPAVLKIRNEETIQSGGNRRPNYETIHIAVVEALLEGNTVSTALDHAADLDKEKHPGDTLTIYYLDKNVYKDADGHLNFSSFEQPVPAGYLNRDVWKDKYAILIYCELLGGIILLLISFRKGSKARRKAAMD